eukprot:15469309-Alexandrium_andersonii.AAC.1
MCIRDRTPNQLAFGCLNVGCWVQVACKVFFRLSRVWLASAVHAGCNLALEPVSVRSSGLLACKLKPPFHSPLPSRIGAKPSDPVEAVFIDDAGKRDVWPVAEVTVGDWQDLCASRVRRVPAAEIL